MRPTISVMMACYNAEQTLPWALASLLAQTFEDWEGIFVDDGSTDSSIDVATRLGDSRIRAFRLDANRGRGAARQFALEQARGQYVCMLDADDWMYPSRLATELDFLEAERGVDVVSTGMAILDRGGNIVGIRGQEPGDKPRLVPRKTVLAMPRVAFAASMIRARVAKRFRFDTEFRLGEDADFLIQVLLQHGYAVLNRTTYAYTEHATVTLEKVLAATRLARRMFRKYSEQFPIQSRVCSFAALMKSLVYRGTFAVGRSEWLIQQRSHRPTLAQFAEFQSARSMVARKVALVSDKPHSAPRAGDPSWSRTREPKVVPTR